MKEMVYGRRKKCKILYSGEYKGHKFAIINLLSHPTAYVELKARLERTIELPYVKRDCELTQIIYKNSYGDMEEETYFHDCYYGERHDVRGDVYAEARLEELKGG